MRTTPEVTPPSLPVDPRTRSHSRPTSKCGSSAGACGGIACFPSSSCQVGQGLWGWSPPLLVADTRLKRWVDGLLPRTGGAALLFWAGFIALLNLAPRLPVRGDLLVDGIATLIGGAWCSLNFWRCRHAHCLVCGAGWLALSLFSFAEAGIGRSLASGKESLVLFGIAAAGLIFEAVWTRVQGSNAVLRISQ
jgi:hypothetical protein